MLDYEEDELVPALSQAPLALAGGMTPGTDDQEGG
jgi:hypothetical protein